MTVKGKLGVILSQFPRYDEAFILRELASLAEGEPGLVIYSLRPCRDKIVHAQAKALMPQTVYAPFFLSASVWASQFYFLSSKPGAYFKALGWILSRHWNHPSILVRSLILFPKTVHFARHAQLQDVRHLHAFWATYPAGSAIIIGMLTGIPFSMSGHAHDIYTINPTLVEKMQRARFVVTCTDANRKHLTALANSHASSICPIVVSYHGVDLKKFAAVAKVVQGPCRLLVVGSLFPCKGLETLVESCRLLRDRGFDLTCTLAGGGPLEKKLRKQIASYKLKSQITITGYVSQEAVAELYQKSHLFVLPLISRIHWGIPNVLIEALATKTPVICCDLPSMKELITHKESGWIIPESDPQALAAAIESLWSDAALRTRIGEAGFNRVIEKFSLERTGAALREVFSRQAQGSAA